MKKLLIQLLVLTSIFHIVSNFNSVYCQGWIKLNPATSPSAYSYHEMAPLGNNKVLLYGGRTKSGTWLDETWIFDLNGKNWTKINTTTQPEIRSGFAMAKVSDGKVLLFGGQIHNSRVYYDDTWLFNIIDGTWTKLSTTNKPAARAYHAMEYICDDSVLMVGGFQYYLYKETNDTWIFDLSEIKWSQMNPSSTPYSVHGHQLAYYKDDRIMLAGGTSNSNDMAYKFIFNISGNNWLKVPNFDIPEFSLNNNCCVENIGNGKIFSYGEIHKPVSSYYPYTSINIYNDGTWTEYFKYIIDQPTNDPNCQNKGSYIKDNFVLMFKNNETWLFDLNYPLLGELSISDISYFSVNLSSNVLNDGDLTMVSRGFCWNTAGNPTINDTKIISDGTGEGSFSSYINMLELNSGYYFRAFAEFSDGTVIYGKQQNIQTLGFWFNISSNRTDLNTLSLSFTIEDYGKEITNKGVVWSTQEHPIMKNPVGGGIIDLGSGTGYTALTITGLLPKETYYIRCFFIDEDGRLAYSEEQSIVNIFTPGVYCYPSEITNNSVTVNWQAWKNTIENTGNGIVWGLHPRPTIEEHYGGGMIEHDITNGETIQNVITNLASSTEYYFGAYAFNETDTAYYWFVSTTMADSSNFYKLSFQGILTNNDGTIISDGDYPMTFKIYSGETVIEPRWVEMQNVTVKNGLFNVYLGSIVPIDLPIPTSYYLGIQIGHSPELSPRTPIVGPAFKNGFGK